MGRGLSRVIKYPEYGCKHSCLTYDRTQEPPRRVEEVWGLWGPEITCIVQVPSNLPGDKQGTPLKGPLDTLASLGAPTSEPFEGSGFRV